MTPAILWDPGGVHQLVPVARRIGIAQIAQDLEKLQPHALQVGDRHQVANEEIAVRLGAGAQAVGIADQVGRVAKLVHGPTGLDAGGDGSDDSAARAQSLDARAGGQSSNEHRVEGVVGAFSVHDAVAANRADLVHAHLLQHPSRGGIAHVGAGEDALQVGGSEHGVYHGADGLRGEALAPARPGDGIADLRVAVDRVGPQSHVADQLPVVVRRPPGRVFAPGIELPLGDKLLRVAAGVGLRDGEIARPLGVGAIGQARLDVAQRERPQAEPRVCG